MWFKRQLFIPGRRIEQIGKLAAHPFFSRRKPDAPMTSSSGAAGSPQRGLLPTLAENAGALFSLVMSSVLVVALVALVFAFIRELRQETVLLETFAAPKELVEQGYTSTVIAEKMLDEIRVINNASASVKTRRALEYGESLPDIQIARSGLSMKSIVRYARRLLDLPDPSIGGEVVRRGTALQMTVRSRDRDRMQVVEVTRGDGDIEALLLDAGRAIIRATDPYTLASYFYTRESDAGSETFPETLAAVDYVLTHSPESDDAWALNLRGNVRRDQGRNEEAVADYRAAIARDPALPIGRGNLALTLIVTGQRDEAMKNARAMLARPDLSLAERADFAEVLLEDGDVRGAMETARQITSHSRQPELVFRGLWLLARCLNLGHRGLEALDAIAKYEQIRGRDPDSLTVRTVAYATLGRSGDAMENVARLYALQPDSRLVWWARGYAFAAMGRYDDAAADFVRLNDKYPDEKCALARLGDVRLSQGNPDAAIAAYRRHESAARKYGHSCTAQADFGWGRALDAVGKPGEAVAKFEASAARDPDNVALWHAWAATLEKLGKKNEAAAKLEEARRAEARLAVPVKLD